MHKKSIVMIILLCIIGFSAGTALYINNNTSPEASWIELPDPTTYTDTSIHITSNSMLTGLGLPGSGSEVDPYILRDLQIYEETLDASDAAIVIKDTTLWLKIENISVIALGNGIILQNVEHIILSNCSVFAEVGYTSTNDQFKYRSFRTLNITNSFNVHVYNSYLQNYNEIPVDVGYIGDQHIESSFVYLINNTFDHIVPYHSYNPSVSILLVGTYDSNTIHNNTFRDTTYGIRIAASSSTLNITNNTFYSMYVAIQGIDATYLRNNISYNIFYGTHVGITLEGVCEYNTISDNWFMTENAYPISLPTRDKNYIYNNHHNPFAFSIAGTYVVINATPYYVINWTTSDYADRYYVTCSNGTNITLSPLETNYTFAIANNGYYTFNVAAESLMGFRTANTVSYTVFYYLTPFSLSVDYSNYPMTYWVNATFRWADSARDDYVKYTLYINDTAAPYELLEDNVGSVALPFGYINLTLNAEHILTHQEINASIIIQVGSDPYTSTWELEQDWEGGSGRYKFTLLPNDNAYYSETVFSFYILERGQWKLLYEGHQNYYEGQAYKTGNYTFKFIVSNLFGSYEIEITVEIHAPNAIIPIILGAVGGSVGGLGIILFIYRSHKTKTVCIDGGKWSLRKRQCISKSTEPRID